METTASEHIPGMHRGTPKRNVLVGILYLILLLFTVSTIVEVSVIAVVP